MLIFLLVAVKLIPIEIQWAANVFLLKPKNIRQSFCTAIGYQDAL